MFNVREVKQNPNSMSIDLGILADLVMIEPTCMHGHCSKLCLWRLDGPWHEPVHNARWHDRDPASPPYETLSENGYIIYNIIIGQRHGGSFDHEREGKWATSWATS